MKILIACIALLFTLPAWADTPSGPSMSVAEADARLDQFTRAIGEDPNIDFSAAVRAQFTQSFIDDAGADRIAGFLARMCKDGFGHLMSVNKIRWEPSEGRWEYSVQTADGEAASIYAVFDAADGNRIKDFRVQRGESFPVPKVSAAQFADVIQAQLPKFADFSGTVIVAKDGKPIVSYAAGLADRASGRKMTLDTPMNLGSANKMFTGTLVAQLVEAGKLHWDDTVGHYLPDYPNATVRDKVTIAMLMTHTAGVPSYWNDAYEKAKKKLHTQQDFLDTFDTEPLEFEPGTQWAYSNGGPVILGRIIEVVTGQDYYAYVREHLYGPLGMTHSDSYRRDAEHPVFATGYMHAEGAPADAPLVPNSEWLGLVGSAAGGGYSTVGDLLKFTTALQSGKLLQSATRERMWQPTSAGGREQHYGYLVDVGTFYGHRRIGHGGGAPGVNASVHFFPDDGYSVIVLSNQDRGAEPVADWIEEVITKNL